MDHIPRPQNCNPLPEVPLVEGVLNYSRYENFENFPRNNGLGDHPQLEATDDFYAVARAISESTNNATQLAVVIQSWLFFCVLAKYTKGPFHPENYIRTSCITLSGIDQKEMLFGQWKILQDAWVILDVLECNPHAGQAPVPVIALSVRILLVSMEVLCAFQIHHQGTSWFGWSWWRQLLILNNGIFLYDYANVVLVHKRPLIAGSRGLPSTDLLMRHMEAAGRCPRETIRFCQTFNYLEICFAAQIRQSRVVMRDHTRCGQSEACPIEDMDSEQYEQKHICFQKSCHSLEIDWKALADIIEKDQIPLLRLSESKNGVQLKVEHARAWSRFTAISHPWSDGMGNSRANSLHECLLRRLLTDMRFMSKHRGRYSEHQGIKDPFMWSSEHYKTKQNGFLFWMDTLCLPAKPEPCMTENLQRHRKDIRRKAIAQMARIYASAERVLVLDEELRATDVSTSHPIDAMALLACSTWGTRAWTYQEGAQSLKCQVLFKNTTIDPRKDDCLPESSEHLGSLWGSLLMPRLWAWDLRKPLKPMEEIVLGSFKIFLNEWFSGSHPSPSEYRFVYDKWMEKAAFERFRRGWNQLSIRKTSVPSDLLTILAMALELPMHGLLKSELTTEERTRLILFSADFVPRSFLYGHRVRKVNADYPNNYWLPHLSEELRYISDYNVMRFNKTKTALTVRAYSDFQRTDHDDVYADGDVTKSTIIWVKNLPMVDQSLQVRSRSNDIHFLVRIHNPEVLSSRANEPQGYCIFLDFEAQRERSMEFASHGQGWISGAIFAVHNIENLGFDEFGDPTPSPRDTFPSRNVCVVCQSIVKSSVKKGDVHGRRKRSILRTTADHGMSGPHCHPWTKLGVRYLCGIQAISLLEERHLRDRVNTESLPTAMGLVLRKHDSSGPRDVELTMTCGNSSH
jgi:hypothetical protein